MLPIRNSSSSRKSAKPVVPIDPAQRFLFDDLGELAPLPRRRKLPPLSYKQRLKRKLAKERAEKKQAFLFGPRVKRKKKTRAIFALFPDIDDFPRSVSLVGEFDDPEACEIIDSEESILPADILELGQLIIRERAAALRETWSENRRKKRNHYFVKPITYAPIDESQLRGGASVDSRE